MNRRARIEDFPVGCTVKVVRLPKRDWHNPSFLGCIGTVIRHIEEEGEHWVDVQFGPADGRTNVMRPWWLERGRVEWIPDSPETPSPC